MNAIIIINGIKIENLILHRSNTSPTQIHGLKYIAFYRPDEFFDCVNLPLKGRREPPIKEIKDAGRRRKFLNDLASRYEFPNPTLPIVRLI